MTNYFNFLTTNIYSNVLYNPTLLMKFYQPSNAQRFLIYDLIKSYN